MKPDPQQLLRSIPSVEAVLQSLGASLTSGVPRPLVVRVVREAVERVRARIMEAGPGHAIETHDVRELARSEVERSLRAARRRRPVRVLNATGIVVHTNLGRAPLSAAALDLISSTGSGYCNLEYDLESAARGSRDTLVREALCELTGAEDALVTNNNAAAVLLALNTIAAGREVVVARGELIEIGGSFRLPDVFEKSGASMVAVGTTNRTRIADFEKAVRNRTAALMSAHWSNYEIVGFVDSVELRDLVALGERVGIPVIHDLGSGATDGLPLPAPNSMATVADVVSDGVSVTTFSGDKLLGGPQAGIAVGRADVIARMRENPLRRALRPGKLTLAALSATLDAHLCGTASHDVPVVSMMAVPAPALEARAKTICDRLGANERVRPTACMSRVGGGSGAGLELASAGLELHPCGGSAESCFRRLLDAEPPVVSRIQDDRVVIDLRTVPPEDDEELAAVLSEVLERDGGRDR